MAKQEPQMAKPEPTPEPKPEPKPEPFRPSPVRSPSSVKQDSENGGKQKNSKSSLGLLKILVIVAAGLGLLALILSAWASYLWWYWPWCITVPGLSLAIAAVILVFACSDHEEAALCCACIAIILNAFAFIWCAVEIGLCHSYQGPILGAVRVMLITFTKNMLETKNEVDKARQYYEMKHYCHGRCYDWGFEAEWRSNQMDCNRLVEQWFFDKYLTSTDKFAVCTTRHYEGVDSYANSPIYKTHEDRVSARHTEYPPKEEKELAKALDKICSDYDDQKFVEKRNECDEQLEDKFKPECKEEYGGWVFTKGKEEDIEKDECKSGSNQKTPVYTEGVWSKIGAIRFLNGEHKAQKLDDKNYKEVIKCEMVEMGKSETPEIPDYDSEMPEMPERPEIPDMSGFGKR